MEPQSKVNDMTIGICDHGLPCCFTNNNVIVTNKGIVNISDYKSGMKLLTRDGFEKPKRVFKHPYKGKVVEILPWYFNEAMTVTPDHPFFVRRFKQCPIKGAGSRCWPNCKSWGSCTHKAKEVFRTVEEVPADQLSVGDLLLVPARKSEFNSHVRTKPLQYLYGVYLAEGCLTGINMIEYTIGANEPEFKQKICDCLEIIGFKYNIYERFHRGKLSWLSIRFASKEFSDNVRELFGTGSTTKFISHKVFKWNRNKLWSFIDGYYDGDGWHSQDSSYIVTTSYQVAHTLQYLLFSLGYAAGLGEYKNSKPDGSESHNNRFHVRWAHRQSNKSILYDGCVCIPIKSLTVSKYKGTVYNFEMPNKSEFCAPVLTHNCPHFCVGIRFTGSPDMTTNSQPSSRLTDLAYHSCPHCPVNMCIEGSGLSSINGLASHRMLDMVTEFCGVGITITGAPDVIVGG